MNRFIFSIIILAFIATSQVACEANHPKSKENSEASFGISDFGISDTTIPWDALNFGNPGIDIQPGSSAMGADSSGGREAAHAVAIQFPVVDKVVNNVDFEAVFALIANARSDDLIDGVFLQIWENSVHLCVDFKSYEASSNMIAQLKEMQDSEFIFRSTTRCKTTDLDPFRAQP